MTHYTSATRGLAVDVRLTAHAKVVMQERGILAAWLELVLDAPARRIAQTDGTLHYLTPIEAFEGRWLRVVVNSASDPPSVVTLFFDRRLP
jgi:hypothetical protein